MIDGGLWQLKEVKEPLTAVAETVEPDEGIISSLWNEVNCEVLLVSQYFESSFHLTFTFNKKNTNIIKSTKQNPYNSNINLI